MGCEHDHTHSESCGHSSKSHKRKHKALLVTSILASGSHVFCCVLPGLFSLLALLSGFGVIIALPGWLDGIHAHMHEWELPVIIFSGAIVSAGWAAHFYSKKHDCHDHGCHHASCQPRKAQTCRILMLASFLFVMNTVIYIGFHNGEKTVPTHIMSDTHQHQ